MKPISPHDPLDDLIAAALHGDLTPAERAQFESRLQTDAAARAAYQQAQRMHDLLEKTHKSAQPDPAFEQRMVSGVRRKLQDDQRPRETAWESLMALLILLKAFSRRFRMIEVAVVLGIIMILAGVSLGPITSGIQKAKENAAIQQARALAMAQADSQAQIDDGKANKTSVAIATPSSAPDFEKVYIPPTQNSMANAAGSLQTPSHKGVYTEGHTVTAIVAPGSAWDNDYKTLNIQQAERDGVPKEANADPVNAAIAMDDDQKKTEASREISLAKDKAVAMDILSSPMQPPTTKQEQALLAELNTSPNSTPAAPPAIDTRKLIRNAQLDLEVKSFQAAMDQITTLTKAAGGYVDTSNSQKGGNGKLQGTVVVKVLPQNLDSFLLKLRDLGELANQSVSTDDVTKDYYDTQARLVNASKMEVQLQELLKRNNGKVSELLQVERELGRVRGDIEQMQGELKLYDFQVQYATVTMQLHEKDLNQTAAYLLKEQDDFSIFATDVEGTFQKARQAADSFKAQILTANLNHNSGSDVSAELEVMVAPDQIEPFLAQVRGLGRVANFTRQTQRVAKDGGDSDQPADQTLTEKDKVQVHLSIRSDDETRKQVALTVVTPAVDTALDQAKTAALANAGAEILSSSLNKTPEGQSTAQLTVRIPGKSYDTLIAAFNALGRTASLSIQRNDDSGPGANGDDAPVIVSLSLTDNETPLQETNLVILGADVDNQAQQLKKDAATAGVEIKASSYQRQPDGTETAQMTFRLPISKYPAFIETLKQVGKVESQTIQRNDSPDQTRTDDTAPAEITLQIHNQRDIVPEDNGLWATLRQTFGDGANALFSSVRVIGVIIAFLIPWVFALGLIAWIARRIYVSRKK